MTQERLNAIAEVLNADEDRAKKLIEMEPAAAAEALKAEGYDFTADELAEFGAIIEKSNQNINILVNIGYVIKVETIHISQARCHDF